MRTGLIVFGVVFLVLGAVLYLWPTQTAGATTTTIGEDGSTTRTTYAAVNVPWPLTLALVVIGLALLVLGFALPGPRTAVKSTPPEASHVVETKEEIETDGDTKRKIVRERHEHRTADRR